MCLPHKRAKLPARTCDFEFITLPCRSLCITHFTDLTIGLMEANDKMFEQPNPVNLKHDHHHHQRIIVICLEFAHETI